MAQKELIVNFVQEEKRPDYVAIENSPRFKEFLNRKKKFLVPMTVFFLIFYFLLPILTSYTTFLNTPAIGDISWTWLFAFAQFVMVWVLSAIYVRKANSFDEEAEEIIDEYLR